MQNWEMWHRHFGHVSYTRLQNLYNKKIVEGFTVDINTPKPDCDACIQAKQTIALFNGKSDQNTKPGDLTHIDLWGKYQIKSIHGNQYYIYLLMMLLVMSQYPSLKRRKKLDNMSRII